MAGSARRLPGLLLFLSFSQCPLPCYRVPRVIAETSAVPPDFQPKQERQTHVPDGAADWSLHLQGVHCLPAPMLVNENTRKIS